MLTVKGALRVTLTESRWCIEDCLVNLFHMAPRLLSFMAPELPLALKCGATVASWITMVRWRRVWMAEVCIPCLSEANDNFLRLLMDTPNSTLLKFLLAIKPVAAIQRRGLNPLQDSYECLQSIKHSMVSFHYHMSFLRIQWIMPVDH